jgi:hypothetical protein
MSEPMYLQGDSIALTKTSTSTQEVQCCVCDSTQDVETEESTSHGETIWYAEWDCCYCGATQEKEGWY